MGASTGEDLNRRGASTFLEFLKSKIIALLLKVVLVEHEPVSADSRIQHFFFKVIKRSVRAERETKQQKGTGHTQQTTTMTTPTSTTSCDNYIDDEKAENDHGIQMTNDEK